MNHAEHLSAIWSCWDITIVALTFVHLGLLCMKNQPPTLTYAPRLLLHMVILVMHMHTRLNDGCASNLTATKLLKPIC